MNMSAMIRFGGGTCVLLAVLVMATGCPPPPPPPPVVTVTVSPASLSLTAGEIGTLSASSSSTSDTSFAWSSSEEGVATVDSAGIVTAVEAGTATITATANSSGSTGTATVTVTAAAVADVSAQLIDNTFTDPSDPDDPGWNTAKIVPAILQTTSGNPRNGGHGAVGVGGKDLSIQAAHDGTTLYMRFFWDDTTKTDTARRWTYSATGWSAGGNEDRLYVSWPIVDGPGRENLTFEEAGCSMTCHQRAVDEFGAQTNDLVPNTTDPVNDCRVCHVLSTAGTIDLTPLFEHPEVPAALNCLTCHGTEDREVVTDGTTFDSADMFAPAGTAFDFWHWKAQRSNPLFRAEDQNATDGTRRTRDGSNLAPDNRNAGGTGPQYIWVDPADNESPIFQSEVDANDARLAGLNESSGEYENLDTGDIVAVNDGDTVTRHILQDGILDTDASANVGANGVFANNSWAVVLWRSITSTDPAPASGQDVDKTDADLNLTGMNLFSVAFTDNSGHNHNGVAGPLSLDFE